MQQTDAGILIYAMDVQRVSHFYAVLLSAQVRHADSMHQVLQYGQIQLIIHAIPEVYRANASDPNGIAPRIEQAFKPFFTVPSLLEAAKTVAELGGQLFGPVWPAPNLQVQNVCDPEGNMIHLREKIL